MTKVDKTKEEDYNDNVRTMPQQGISRHIKKINIKDVKTALLDARFRETLPKELDSDVEKFLQNPGCVCNHPIYVKVIKEAKKQLLDYYPGKTEVEEFKAFENHWSVINCKVDELAERLRMLGPGRKQIDMARFQDEITVIINDLDVF